MRGEKEMKNGYIKPEMKITEFEHSRVLTLSTSEQPDTAVQQAQAAAGKIAGTKGTFVIEFN